jgi:hypothetical protein
VIPSQILTQNLIKISYIKFHLRLGTQRGLLLWAIVAMYAFTSCSIHDICLRLRIPMTLFAPSWIPKLEKHHLWTAHGWMLIQNICSNIISGESHFPEPYVVDKNLTYHDLQSITNVIYHAVLLCKNVNTNVAILDLIVPIPWQNGKACGMEKSWHKWALTPEFRGRIEENKESEQSGHSMSQPRIETGTAPTEVRHNVTSANFACNGVGT